MFRPEWDGQVCSLGYDVVDWIEAYCCHGPGDVQGKPVELDAEMTAFVVRAYELDPKTGRRKIDRAMLSRPKGRAKSELAGMIATAEAFGPVRFDGWNASGQPTGRPVVSPLIKCLATEESQAGNTFENAAFIVSDWGRDAHPDIYGGASGVRQYQSATAIYLPGGGEMRASTSGSASKDGGKESFVVPDETHLYVTNELRSMYATVARNCGKRKEAQPWMLQTTTAYEEGRNSVAEQVLTAWKAGKLPNPAHWLVDHREAIGSVDVTNRLHTLEQLRYVYGAASGWMDLDRIYRSMLDPTECETAEVAARYFLNVPIPRAAGDGGALNLTAWAAQAANPPPLKRPLAWGVDLDQAGVGTIAVAWRRPDRRVHAQLVARSTEDPKALAFTATQLAPRAQELRRKYGGKVWAGGGAASLLEDASVVSGPEFAAACETVADLLASSELWHCSQPDLDRAIEAARWRPVGTAAQRAWQLKNAPGIGPLAALTRAIHGLVAVPADPPPAPVGVKNTTPTADVDRLDF